MAHTRNLTEDERKQRIREIDREGARAARKVLHKTMKKRGYTVPTRGKRTAA